VSTIYLYPEFSLPPSLIAFAVEMKYCEQCGRPFSRKFAPTEPEVRKEQDVLDSYRFSTFLAKGKRFRLSDKQFTVIRRRDHGVRYCSKCRFAPIPDIAAQEDYKAQLPGTQNQMKHSMRLPKYDESLAALYDNGYRAQLESAKKSARLLKATLQ
jgi:hypothetical protein